MAKSFGSAAAKGNCLGNNFFVIAALIVFFMLLYVFIGAWYARNVEAATEKFSGAGVNHTLISPDKIVSVQGNGIPPTDNKVIEYDQLDPSMQPVDGVEGSPKSLFMFAYNKCDVSCCGDSGGYGCNGGCVCLTNEQKKFMSNRGTNNKFDSEY